MLLIQNFTLKQVIQLCLDIDECNSMPCLNGGVCSNAAAAFVCECNYGYEGDLCGIGKHQYKVRVKLLTASNSTRKM